MLWLIPLISVALAGQVASGVVCLLALVRSLLLPALALEIGPRFRRPARPRD